MATMVKLQTVTVGSGGAASIDFTSIPQTYTDLKIVFSLRSTNAVVNQQATVKFNTSSTGFTSRYMYGNAPGGNVPSATNAYYGGNISGASATANVFSNIELYIPNYTSSNNKSFSVDSVQEDNSTSGFPFLVAGLWSNTDAINAVSILGTTGNLAQYSTATLYGVKNVTTATGTGKATGGDQIYTDGTYWYHRFTTVGTSSFTPLTSLTADYLVVAGGGGGGLASSGSGSYGGGGGGAGGVRCTVGATGGGGSLESALSLTAQAYTVTVGDGGASDTSGSNSVFSSITATGGGRGSNSSVASAGTGGSGGGGSLTINGAAGTANQGYAGGNSGGSTSSSGGGGGGAGGAGTNGTNGSTGTVGQGGSGISTSISGTSTTYARGGNGGVSNADTNGAAGTSNTGNGGVGAGIVSGGNTTGGKGGSGIVIVRYAV